jgi:hypothetical protein
MGVGYYLALHDRRLVGGVPARKNLTIINTNEDISLRSAFHGINSARAAARAPLDAVFILCHGYAGTNDRQRVCMDAGGMGLELGREDVVHENVFMWRSIANSAKTIVVYSCAAANTEKGNEGTTADGRYLMGALAIHTNAVVYGANRIQWYSTYKGLPNGRFDWGDWEGTLYQFPPDGSSPTIVDRAPIEFADVMSGSAQ